MYYFIIHITSSILLLNDANENNGVAIDTDCLILNPDVKHRVLIFFNILICTTNYCY